MVLILSEFKLDFSPTHYSFPQRNRIVAGLADVVFVPEAGSKSGSLITVDFAYSMKKPIYGTPANMFSSTSSGLLSYLQKGVVKVLYDIESILSKHYTKKISTTKSDSNIHIALDPLQQKIISLCIKNPSTLEAIVSACECSTQEALHALTMLELQGLIYQSGPNTYLSTQKCLKL